MAYRLLKVFLFVFIGVVLLVCALAVWLVSTTQGNRELSFLATMIEPRIEMDIYQGNVVDGIEAHGISWTDDFLTVSASQVKTKWNPACFLKRALCAESVYLESLTVKTRPNINTPRTGDIKIPAINLPVNLSLSDLQVGKLILDFADSTPPLEVSDIRVSATNNGTNVDIHRLSARYKNIVTSTKGDIDLRGNLSLNLAISAIVEDAYEAHNLLLNANASGSLDNLFIAGSSTGLLETTFSSNTNTLAENLPSKARVSWKSIGWPLTDQSIVKISDGTLLLDGTFKQYTLDFQSQVSGNEIPESELKLLGLLKPLQGITIENLKVKTLGGQISGVASVNWENWKSAIDWTSQLSFSELDPNIYKPGMPNNLAGTVFASGSVNRDKTWTLDLKPAVVQGTFNDHPFHTHAILVRSGKARWNIESLRLISKDNKLTISGQLDDEWSMNGDLRLSKIQQFIPKASGSIVGSIAITGAAEKPIAGFDIRSKQLKWQNDSAEGLTLSGRIENFFNNDSIVHLNAKTLTVDNRKIGTLGIEFTGMKSLHNIKFNAQSIGNTSASMTLDGELRDNYDWKGKLFNASVKIAGHDLDLVSAMTLNFNKAISTLTISPHCWANLDGNICLKNTLNASNSGRAEISVSAYSLSQLKQFLPTNTTLIGKARADIELDWGGQIKTGLRAIINADVVNGNLAINSKGDGKDLELAFKKMSIDTFFDRSDIRTNVQVESEKLGTADVSFSIKPDVKPLSFTRGTLKLSNLDVRFLQPFLPELQTISGKISADGKITGAVIDPAFVGKLTLSDPVLKSDQLPLQITGGQVQAAIAGRKANISGAINSGNGIINLFGEADWEDLAAWSLIVNAQGDALVINQKPLVESVVAPNIVMSIKPNKVNVGGNIKIVTAAMNIKQIPEGATNLSTDIVLANTTIEDSLKESKWTIESDITIILGNAVSLSGYGMRAQLTGDFRVVKTDNKPLLLFGEIEIPTGIYKSYGQDLKVDDGQVIFVGPINQTTLNIDAYRKVEEVTAGLHLSGTIDKPLVTLYSEPFLEQERILAYIVLGRDIAAGDNNDSNILATAALSMGISNGRGLATNIAEAFGIREFNIEASGRGEDTQVLLSGRLSEKLLIRYGVGVFTPVNTLYLRYDLSKKLYLETAQGLERAADLIYSFEF